MYNFEDRQSGLKYNYHVFIDQKNIGTSYLPIYIFIKVNILYYS